MSEKLLEEINSTLVDLIKLRTPNFQPKAIILAKKREKELISYAKTSDCEMDLEEAKQLADVIREAIREIEYGRGKSWTDMYYMMVSTDKGFMLVEDFEEGFIIITVLPKGFLKFHMGEKFKNLHEKLINSLKEYLGKQ